MNELVLIRESLYSWELRSSDSSNYDCLLLIGLIDPSVTKGYLFGKERNLNSEILGKCSVLKVGWWWVSSLKSFVRNHRRKDSFVAIEAAAVSTSDLKFDWWWGFGRKSLV